VLFAQSFHECVIFRRKLVSWHKQ